MVAAMGITVRFVFLALAGAFLAVLFEPFFSALLLDMGVNTGSWAAPVTAALALEWVRMIGFGIVGAAVGAWLHWAASKYDRRLPRAVTLKNGKNNIRYMRLDGETLCIVENRLPTDTITFVFRDVTLNVDSSIGFAVSTRDVRNHKIMEDFSGSVFVSRGEGAEIKSKTWAQLTPDLKAGVPFSMRVDIENIIDTSLPLSFQCSSWGKNTNGKTFRSEHRGSLLETGARVFAIMLAPVGRGAFFVSGDFGSTVSQPVPDQSPTGLEVKTQR